MKLTAKVLVPILAVSLSQIARAVIIDTAQSGIWSDPLSWNGGVPDPYAGDSVTINSTHVINFNDIGANTGPLSTPMGLVGTGGFAIANGNVVLIDGGTLNQTTLTQEMRIGEGTGSLDGTGFLTIQAGGLLDTGASIGLAVGTKIGGAVAGSGQLDIFDGTLKLGGGASAGGLGVGVDSSSGLLNVGDGLGGANTALVDLATNNVRMGVGANPGALGGGTGIVNIKGDGKITFGTAGINIGQGGGNGTMNIFSVGSLIGGSGNIIVGDGTGSIGALANAGTISSTGQIRIGSNGGLGTFMMTGGSVATTGQFVVGQDSAATNAATISAGTVTSGAEFRVGEGTGAVGTLALSGTGSLTAGGELQVGNDAGNGTLNMSGGTITANSWVAIGRNGGTGIVNLSGGTITKSGGQSFDIGVFGGNGNPFGTGTINQTGGSIVSTGSDTNIGRDGSGIGFWNMNGGTANLATLNVGNNGQGTLIMDGVGTVINAAGESHIGTNNGSVGVMTVRNGAAVHFNGGWAAKVGTNGGSDGTVNVETGGKFIATNSWVVVGAETGSTGTMNISDATNAGTLVDVSNGEGRFITARLGTATVNQSGGAVKTGNWFAIALDPGSNGTYNFSGGTIQLGNTGQNIDVASKGTGTLNITNGNAAGTTISAVGGVVNNINVGGDTGGNGTLNINLANATDKIVSRELYAGNNATTVGVININSGTLQTNEWVEIGRNGGTGTINVAGPNARWERGTLAGGQQKDVQIGYNGGTGSLNVSNGGTVNQNWWFNVGRGATSTGHITVDGAGSTINQTAGFMNIGEDGVGTLAVTNGGTLNTVDEFSVGRNGGSNGTVTLSGAGSVINLQNHLFVGRNGTGTFNQSGGTINLNGKRIQIGDSAGSTGTYNITAGAVNNSQWLHIASGAGSTGTLNVNFTNPADALTTGDLYLGNNSATANGFANVTNGNLRMTGVAQVGRYGGTGTLTVTGPNSVVESFYGGGNDFFKVGMNGGHGIVNVSAGGKIKTNAGWFTLANDGAVGDATFTGAGTTLTSTGLIVGWSGLSTGTLTIADNAVVNNSGHEVSVGRDDNGVGNSPTGTININSGGVLNAGNDLRLGHNAVGNLNINGGTLNAAGGWAIIGDGGNSKGTVNMTSGAFNHPNDTLFIGNNPGAQGTFTQTGGTTYIGNELNLARDRSFGTLNVNGGTFTVNGWTTIGRDNNGNVGGQGTINVANGGIFQHPNSGGGDLLLGWKGGSSGALNVSSGGKVIYNWWIRAAVDGGSTGAITVDGAGSTLASNTGRMFIGESGTGTLTITNGGAVTRTNSDWFVAGGNDGANSMGNGTVTISGAGSLLSSNNFMAFGRGRQDASNLATGTLNMTSGTISSSGSWIGFGTDGGQGTANISGTATGSSGGETIIGRTPNSFGTFNLSGAAVWNSGGEFQVGNNGGTGVANISGGTLNLFSYMAIGRNQNDNGGLNGGNGTLNLSGAAVINKVNGNGTFDIGSWNGGNNATANTTGTLNQTGGSINNTVSDTHIGRDTGVVGVWNLTAGTAALARLNVGNNGIGTLNMNGGSLSASDRVSIAANGGSTGTANLSGGILTTNFVEAGGGTASLNIGGLTLRAFQDQGDFLRGFTNSGGHSAINLVGTGGTIDTNGFTVGITAGNILDGTSLTKAGAGTLNINATQTYNALTTNGGVTNIYTALGTGTSTITANATLNIYVSQTLASLTIADGVEVTFGDGLAFAPEPPKASAPFGGGGAGLVPEPGSLGLLLVGAVGFIARRRRSR